MKEPHTALSIALTGVGKTHLALSLLETEYTVFPLFSPWGAYLISNVFEGAK